MIIEVQLLEGSPISATDALQEIALVGVCVIVRRAGVGGELAGRGTHRLVVHIRLLDTASGLQRQQRRSVRRAIHGSILTCARSRPAQPHPSASNKNGGHAPKPTGRNAYDRSAIVDGYLAASHG
jgi:hypothetical protein